MAADDRMVLAQITITKYLDEDVEGGVGLEVEYSDELPLIEAMGLLTFATLGVQADYETFETVDEDDN